jgi:hypothetical protein
MFSLSHPDYSTDISIMAEPASRSAGELPAESAGDAPVSGLEKQ